MNFIGYLGVEWGVFVIICMVKEVECKLGEDFRVIEVRVIIVYGNEIFVFVVF